MKENLRMKTSRYLCLSHSADDEDLLNIFIQQDYITGHYTIQQVTIRVQKNQEAKQISETVATPPMIKSQTIHSYMYIYMCMYILEKVLACTHARTQAPAAAPWPMPFAESDAT